MNDFRYMPPHRTSGEARALSLEQTFWRPLRDDEYSSMILPITLQRTAALYGIALDLGTTHIRLTLWDLVEGKRIAGRVGRSPAAQASGSMVRHAIAEALAEIATQTSIDLQEIGKVLAVGNAAMLGLLFDKERMPFLQPENRMLRIDCQPDEAASLCKAWGIDGGAAIRFIVPVDELIGSDLLAGVIAARLMEQPAASLFIEFGSNSRMALWDGCSLHATSIAGGAVFEGGGISCGMPGEDGAIYRVRQSGGDGFAIGVQGKTPPLGLNGSGLVDAVAWLRRNGRVDKTGQFTEGDGFVLHDGEPRVILKHADIDALRRAKAAIGGGVHWLCRQAGVPLEKLQMVFVCGAFGHLLDVDNARQIGLLPQVCHTAFRLESNAALVGCEMLLLSTEGMRTLETVAAMSKIYNLAENAGFESLFMENLHLQPMRESDPVSEKTAGSDFVFSPLPIPGENGSC